ncbi:MAG: hypothetical protein JSV94_00895 [Methanobacteriota archaeon]|nr:MAG: hypothetical protein JSV94_00895 [Euryarchaeota archaeon]
MARKSDRTESKKECPSCGLGVSEQNMICEFCGWDFEEEDEWILQIEKLERELMLEKQRHEPGTVNHMIESTLRTPASEKMQAPVPTPEAEVEEDEPEPSAEWSEEAFEDSLPFPESSQDETPEPVPEPTKRPKVRRVRSVKASTHPPARTDAEPDITAVPADKKPSVRRTRVVRKVKKR